MHNVNARSLTRSETAALENQGCFSTDWSKVTVMDGFSTDHVHRVRFSGKVRIGSTESGTVDEPAEVAQPGLYDVSVDNCNIGDGVRIHRVGMIRNYRVMEGAMIENVNEITVSGGSTFGNGVGVAVLNEAGGREVLIFDRLNAQLAYLMAFYRHDARLQKALEELVADEVRMVYSQQGTIGKGARISNAGVLKNMRIGDGAVISGALLLENGSLISSPVAPVEIGEGVIASDFIVQSGSAVQSWAILDKCFVGQGVSMGKQFSAENSVFFANCEAFHGEAVSIFAGPYTVTHHKSTLLIAGFYSFFNAGSGTNHSNHMYKLGPVHQGILERGSKTGSFAYLMWPSRVGPFTVVMGKHSSGFDAGDFPFSYIHADGDRSFLTPGINLVTAGTRRDSEKWPKRDRRTDPEKFDLVRFDLLNPYVIGKMHIGLEILTRLYENPAREQGSVSREQESVPREQGSVSREQESVPREQESVPREQESVPREQESVLYRGIRIKRLMVKSTRRYYEHALSVFTGQQLVKRLEGIGMKDTMESIRARLVPETAGGSGTGAGGPAKGVDGPGADRSGTGAGIKPVLEKWVDMAGMIAPSPAIDQLAAAIGEGGYGNVEQVRQALEEIHDSYDTFAWNFTVALLKQRQGLDVAVIGPGELVELINRWQSGVTWLNKMILNDAAKEFDKASRIGYGHDGDDGIAEADFNAVRGTFEENSFILDIHRETVEIEKKAAGLKALLGRL